MAGQTLTFTLDGRDRLSRVLDGAGDSAGKLHTKLSLATAAIPTASAMAPFILGTGAAAVAVAAFGAAIIPQIGALSDAAQAQKKYEDAVAAGGPASDAAIKAGAEYQRQLAKMPPATRQAAAALGLLKDEYQGWSDELADDTMPVFNKGVALAGALLPKLTPLVKGASTELGRFMTIVGGTISTPGFDALNGKFDKFATGSLQKANDAVVHFLRVLDTGAVGGDLAQFMDYARAQGPLVGDTLHSIALAAIHVLTAASATGVSVLGLANSLAKVVAALPPGFITLLLQASLAIRAITLAITGVKLASAAFTLVRTQIVAASTAALGASTTMGSLRAAFLALSLSAKTAVAATGIGAVILALVALSNIGRQSAPDVDKLTTSLAHLGDTGKVSGEAAKAFGSDLSGLSDSLRIISRPSISQGIDQWAGSLVGIDTRPVGDAKKDLDSIDKALASLVKSGQADLAAAALKELGAGMDNNSLSAKELNAQMGDYKSALADAAFEAKLTAQAQGLFGAQAQQVAQKLDAQKASADGLRGAIQALNDIQRAGLGGQIGFEAAIDAASAAAKENGRSLHMVNGELQLGSEKARGNATALQELAAKTDANAASARDNGASWATVNGIYAKGRTALIDSAMQMGLTRAQAKQLADQISRTPDKTARLKGNMEDLQAKLNSAKNQLKTVPDSRKAAVRATIAQLESQIRSARAQLNGLDGKTVNTYVRTNYVSTLVPGSFGGTSVYATGGLVGFPSGGQVSGPGTGTSDSILARLSDGEYVIPAKQVAQYGTGFFDAIRGGKLGTASAKAGAGRGVAPVARSGGGAAPIINITVQGAIDPLSTAKQIQKLLLELQRAQGRNVNLLGVGR